MSMNFAGQVRVRVLNVDSETRKLVLSMRSKSRAPITEQGDINKYAKMLEEVRGGSSPARYSVGR